MICVLTLSIRKMLKQPLYAALPPLTPPKIGGEPIQIQICIVLAVSSPPILGGAGGGNEERLGVVDRLLHCPSPTRPSGQAGIINFPLSIDFHLYIIKNPYLPHLTPFFSKN